MRLKPVLLFCWLFSISLNYLCAQSVLSPEQTDYFEKKIRPLLVERCYGCHSVGATDLKAGLLLDSQGGMLKGGDSGKPAIVPFNPDSSLLVQAVRYENDSLQMPPQKAGGKLSESEIEDLVAWIKMGAPDPRTNAPAATVAKTDVTKHWAWKPVSNPPIPVVRDAKWVQTSIDAFILEKLQQAELQPSEKADKRTLIRRVTFDLTGLPPRPEAVDAFLRDTSRDAFSKLVDQLLASPAYGEKWGRHWLDVARYADTKGYVYGGREESRFVHSYAYRDWVINALNNDMPYDRFLRMQIAADQVEDAGRQDLAAMGFLTVGRRFLGIVHDIIDDRIDVVARGTLGLTVSCARCHDHKYDPIPTADYYSLYGIFAGSTERTLALASTNESAKAYLEFERELKLREERYQSAFQKKRDEMNARLRKQAPDYLKAVLDVQKLTTEGFYSFLQGDELNPVIVRQWDAYLRKTKSSFHPVWAIWNELGNLPSENFAAKAKEVIARTSTNSSPQLNPLIRTVFEKSTPTNMTEVAARYREALEKVQSKTAPFTTEEEQLRAILFGTDSPAAVPSGAIVDLEWFFDEPTRIELGKLAMEIDQWIIQSPGAPPHAVILEDRPVQKNGHVFKRGNPSMKGEEVPRQFLALLSGPDRKPFQKGSGRGELASAIANRNNPLTARVMVNRVWAHHFGNGLVRTTSDFGVRAEPPSHPELLDHLATSFMDNGWSLKKLHRMIVMSAVYQASSAPSSAKEEARIAAIDPENRLLSHMNRQRLGFEALRDSFLFVAGQMDGRVGGKAEELFKAPFSKRRSVYGYIDRQFLPGPFRVFDFANPDMHTPQRSETTIPQQALFFMNGPFAVEQAKALAAKAGAHDSAKAQVSALYRQVFQREPTKHQLQLALQFLREADAPETVAAEPTNSLQLAWHYGFGEVDETTGQLKSFTHLPHFTGTAWQGGSTWPDNRLGWLQLTETGGHAGNDSQHAVVRRWISPVDGSVEISGVLKHERVPGQGIKGYILSNKRGALGRWTLHNNFTDTKVPQLLVHKGDTVDFAVSIAEALNNNDFVWTPVIKMTGDNAVKDQNGYPMTWDAKKDFAGPAPAKQEKPLTPLEAYTQALLLSNEFMFVD